MVDTQTLDVRTGDILLLCSDGLTEELVEEQIQSCLEDDNLPSCLEDDNLLKKTATSLIEKAKEEGGHDNITVVLVSVKDQV